MAAVLLSVFLVLRRKSLGLIFCFAAAVQPRYSLLTFMGAGEEEHMKCSSPPALEMILLLLILGEEEHDDHRDCESSDESCSDDRRTGHVLRCAFGGT
jgi:hypothetical protein